MAPTLAFHTVYSREMCGAQIVQSAIIFFTCGLVADFVFLSYNGVELKDKLDTLHAFHSIFFLFLSLTEKNILYKVLCLHTSHNLPPMILNPRDPDVLCRVTLRLLVSSPWDRTEREKQKRHISYAATDCYTAGFNTASLTTLTISPLRSGALPISYSMNRQSHMRFQGIFINQAVKTDHILRDTWQNYRKGAINV